MVKFSIYLNRLVFVIVNKQGPKFRNNATETLLSDIALNNPSLPFSSYSLAVCAMIQNVAAICNITSKDTFGRVNQH